MEPIAQTYLIPPSITFSMSLPLLFTQTIYNPTSSPQKILLTADIGGTNTTFGIFEPTPTGLELLLTLHLASNTITNFPHIIKSVQQHLQEKYNAPIIHACFAVAGPINENKTTSQLTNLPWNIDTLAIESLTHIKPLLLNDFEAIGYGIDALPPEDILIIKDSQPLPKHPRAILGAGTDLGKSMLIWNNQKQHYFPLASEGGHATLAIEQPDEFLLLQSLQTHYQNSQVTWGDVLSGRGIHALYLSLNTHYPASDIRTTITNSPNPPAQITKHHLTDPQCTHTLQLFTRFYARAARTLALDSLAFGGIYIAGGIAAKHPEIFTRYNFTQEFHNSKKMSHLLKQIPLFLITNYHAGLYGAARYILIEKMK